MYEMPEPVIDLEDVQERSPAGEQILPQTGPQIDALQSLNFYKAKILAFFQLKTEEGTGYVLITKGEKLRSSVTILDENLH